MGPFLLLLLVTTSFWLWDRSQKKGRERTIRNCPHCKGNGRTLTRVSGTWFDPDTTRDRHHQATCPWGGAIK